MSLSHTSDDSLAQILLYLEAKDVLQLMAVGSKSLNARILQNLTEMVWTFDRPAFFPFCSFDFLKLRTLHIDGHKSGHLSLQSRPLRPLNPMKSLETLYLNFPLWHLIFEPQSSQSGLSLSSLFPNLTSLTIASDSKLPLPQAWAESLPQSLTALSIESSSSSDNGSHLGQAIFALLPKGIQKIQLLMPISAGALDLKPFVNLRVLMLTEIDSLDVLDALPDSIEELTLRISDDNDAARNNEGRIFFHSKFPPKIRIFNVSPYLTLEADCMAPPTLEELHGIELLNEASMKFFHSKNLRILSSELVDMTPELGQLLPNLERMFGPFTSSEYRPQILPRRLKVLPLLWLRKPGSLLKDLPPSLESYHQPIYTNDNLLDLPRSIRSLSIQKPGFQMTAQPTLSQATWISLPPKLQYLNVSFAAFGDVSNDLLVLPRTLEILTFSLNDLPPNSDVVERISFLYWMNETITSLTIISRRPRTTEVAPVEKSCVSLIPKLSGFSVLSSLEMRSEIDLKSDTLSHLPTSLTNLALQCREMENFGLPVGLFPEEYAHWKEGVFSRLPEGLRALKVEFSATMSNAIDFNVFSHLPKRLAELNIDSAWSSPKNLECFFAALPRRLSVLKYHYNSNWASFKVKSEHFDAQFDAVAIADQLQDEIKKYYSDPFWEHK